MFILGIFLGFSTIHESSDPILHGIGMNTTCPLCSNNVDFVLFDGPDRRTYHCCDKCSLVFVDKRFLPSREEEEKRYRHHHNGIENPGYSKFLGQAIESAMPFLTKEMHGLDYGCGPDPVLSQLLARRGLDCQNYDPIFYPSRPKGTFDFIFATESFEHFFSPGDELCKIKSLLKPGALLIVMTEKWQSREAFADWYYARDITHVCFFHESSFVFIAEEFKLILMKSDNPRVVIMQNLSACPDFTGQSPAI